MSSLNNNHCSVSPPRRVTLQRQSLHCSGNRPTLQEGKLEVSIGEDRARKVCRLTPQGRRRRDKNLVRRFSFRRCGVKKLWCHASSRLWNYFCTAWQMHLITMFWGESRRSVVWRPNGLTGPDILTLFWYGFNPFLIGHYWITFCIFVQSKIILTFEMEKLHTSTDSYAPRVSLHRCKHLWNGYYRYIDSMFTKLFSTKFYYFNIRIVLGLGSQW